jgi:hypothetical protein
MSKQIILARIRQRVDTLANWAEANPVLLDGELGIVRDCPDLYKVGDGVSTWSLLPFRGFNGNIEQQEGGNPHAVMSQQATTKALETIRQDTTQVLNTKATKTEVEALKQQTAQSLTQLAQTTSQGLAAKAEKAFVAELVKKVDTLSLLVAELSGKVEALIAGGGGATTPSNKIGSAVVGEATIG